MLKLWYATDLSDIDTAGRLYGNVERVVVESRRCAVLQREGGTGWKRV